MGLITLAAALVLAGTACTRESETPKASATPVPAAPKAAAPAAPAAPKMADEGVEELYVDLEAEPDEGAPPLTVKFITSVEDAAPPLTYTWNFGDGSPASGEAAPTHVYQKAGEYTATVSVKDSKGQTGSEEVDVIVEVEE
jgi:PKD repeat protein